jgi:hypothetical protein
MRCRGAGADAKAAHGNHSLTRTAAREGGRYRTAFPRHFTGMSTCCGFLIPISCPVVVKHGCCTFTLLTKQVASSKLRGRARPILAQNFHSIPHLHEQFGACCSSSKGCAQTGLEGCSSFRTDPFALQSLPPVSFPHIDQNLQGGDSFD